VKVVVVGASSGLGRALAVGLGQRDHDVALLARRVDRLERAVDEIGDRAHAIACDVTDEVGCHGAIEAAAAALGGIDALVYSTGLAVLNRIEALTAADWNRVLGTNLVGASLATAAALPHLRASSGCAIYFSSVSASMTPPWPGLAAYITSKAALDKLIDAWRVEHHDVGFTRLIVGDTSGGEGESMTGFIDEWDPDLRAEFGMQWYAKGYIAGALFHVDELVGSVEHVIGLGSSAVIPSITVMPRVPRNEG